MFCSTYSRFLNYQYLAEEYCPRSLHKQYPLKSGVYPSTLPDLRFCIEDWDSITNDHKTRCVSTLKMGVEGGSIWGFKGALWGARGCWGSLCRIPVQSPWKLSLFWCTKMFKQPVRCRFLMLISTQILCF